jgi:hypothetical protein
VHTEAVTMYTILFLNLRCLSPQLTLSLSTQMQTSMHRTFCAVRGCCFRQACDSHVCCVSQVITSMNRPQQHQMNTF